MFLSAVVAACRRPHDQTVGGRFRTSMSCLRVGSCRCHLIDGPRIRFRVHHGRFGFALISAWDLVYFGHRRSRGPPMSDAAHGHFPRIVPSPWPRLGAVHVSPSPSCRPYWPHPARATTVQSAGQARSAVEPSGLVMIRLRQGSGIAIPPPPPPPPHPANAKAAIAIAYKKNRFMSMLSCLL